MIKTEGLNERMTGVFSVMDASSDKILLWFANAIATNKAFHCVYTFYWTRVVYCEL